MRKTIITALMLLAPGTAFAYFDPGTGGLIIQGLVGSATFVIVFWGKLKLYVRSFFFKDQKTAPSHGTEASIESDDQKGVEADAEHR